MISAATPLRKIVRVVEHIDDLEGYNILNVLQNHNLVNPTNGFFDSSLVTEAHIPILLDIINKFASEADSEMWFQYINSDRPRLGKLEDIWEDIKLRRKEAKKKPLLDYVPSPGSKSKVYEEVLNMSDEEFSYLSSLRNQESIRQASPSSHPETQVTQEYAPSSFLELQKLKGRGRSKAVHPFAPLPPRGPVPKPRRESNIIESFPNKYIPPPPEPLPRYVDSEEYANSISAAGSIEVDGSEYVSTQKYTFPKFKDQKIEFIKDRMFDARANIKKVTNAYAEDLLKELNSKPLDTVIDLRKLDASKEDASAKLLEWFENSIASQLSDRLYIRFKLANESRDWAVPLSRYIEQVRKLFSEGRLLSIEEENSMIGSDDELQFYWNLVDSVEFFIAKNTSQPKNARKKHANGFFPKKLIPQYQEFEQVLERYQIYYSYVDDNGKVKKDVNTSCLIHCLLLSGIDSNTCANIVSRFCSNGKRIQRDVLGEIGKEFNLYFHVRIWNQNKGKIDNANQNSKGWYGSPTGKQIKLAEYLDHFFLDEETKICRYAINNWLDICSEYDFKPLEWRLQVFAQQDGKYKSSASRAKASSLEVVIALDKADAFENINANAADVQKARVFTSEVVEEEVVAREYIKEHETKKIAPKESKPKAEHKIFYADIETCRKYDGEKYVCIPFMLCASDITGSWKKTYEGNLCVDSFLEDLPKNALVYFHNLGFDGNFFKNFGYNVMIQKGSKIMSMQTKYANKTIYLRDSYSLLAKPLRDFPKVFPKAFPENMIKEVFPYDYYTFERVFNHELGSISDALEYIKEEEHQQFIQNIDTIGARTGDDSFEMMEYCRFYCERDVEVLRIGFNEFCKLTLEDPIKLNIHDYLSAPSLAYEYMLQNVFYPNKNLYNVGGQLQKYLQKFVYGGRVMTKNNLRYDIKQKLADFDACSLYPSAMRRAFTVEGVPEYYKNPTPEQVFNKDNLPEILTKAFTEDQLRSIPKRCYSQFFIEIQITKIGIERAFPLIVKRENGKQTNVNECVKMFVDMIMLQDLIEFQDISFTFVDGYVMKGNRDHRIREVIKKLYDLRVEYKKNKNPMQEIIKLIMNSAYGKSIQKVIKTELKYIDADKAPFKLYDMYYQIHKAEQINDNKWLFETYKRRNNQFSNSIFGITVLSMSKRIMNEVMCLAEDLGIEIYYQDTDSMHIEYDKVDYLDEEFTKKYNRKLIGSGMGNFHTDFEPANAYCIRHISLGKKMYLDVLEFEDSNHKIQHKNHIRMKGIPGTVIENHATKYFNGDVQKLYEHIFNGQSIEFNLLDGKVCMKASRNGTVSYANKFSRNVKATSQ